MAHHHPDIHAPWSKWSEEQTLHVAIAYSNPFRWRTRRVLANNCIRHLQSCPNVVVHIGELCYGDRPPEITEAGNPLHVQLRVDRNELFSKENILNIVVGTYPEKYLYGCAIDADWHFTRHDWALETIHQLQHYKWVQPYSSYTDLSGDVYGKAQIPVRTNTGFFFNYVNNGYKVSEQYHNGKVPDGTVDPDGYEGAMFMRGVGATGGAYAWRHSAFDAVGGFLDRCILGHADWYMAYQLVGMMPPDIHSQKYHPNYKAYVTQWGERAADLLKNVGYVDGYCIHYWHGSKSRRAYSSRDVILANRQYDPYSDVYQTHQGIWQLNPKKTELRDDIRAYFISRSEDDQTLNGAEKLSV